MASRSNKKAADNSEELQELNQRADQNTEDMSRGSIVGEEGEEEGEPQEEGEGEETLEEEEPPHIPVLGAVGFNLGSHTWDVQIPASHTNWEIGVFAESAKNSGNIESGLWSIRYNGGEYSSWTPDGKKGLPKRRTKIQTVKVTLNSDNGTLRFSVVKDLKQTRIHSFEYKFTEMMFTHFTWE